MRFKRLLRNMTSAYLLLLAGANPVFGEPCSAFTHALVDRADFYLQAIMNSNAFWTCINERLRGTSGGNGYTPSCAHVPPPGRDPSGVASLSAQIANIRQVLYAGNHITPICDYSSDSAYTLAGPGDVWNSQNTSDGIFLSKGWGQAFVHWSTYYYPPEPGYRPWNFKSAELVHEFLHEHLYDDRGSCPAKSANYLVDTCVAHTIEQSRCAGMDNNLDACADPEAVNLPGSWDIANDRPDQNQANCVCVKGVRHRIGLRTQNGLSFVSSIDGGGGRVDAHAIGFGSWEATRVIDLTRMQGRHLDGDMADQDFVQFRAPNGQLWRAHDGVISADCTEAFPPSPRANINTNLSTRPSDACTFQLHKVRGTGGNRIIDGNVISIQAFDNRYLSALNGGGSGITADRAVADNPARFMVQRPRRAWFVSIQSQNGSGRYLTYENDGTLKASATMQTDAAAYWIVDHNGSDLRSTDEVSLESDAHPGAFIETCSNGLGPVRADAATMRDCSKFVITRIAGSGPIATSDEIALASVKEGRYLTAEPPMYGSTVWNNAEVVLEWEKFKLVPYAPTAGPTPHLPWTVD